MKSQNSFHFTPNSDPSINYSLSTGVEASIPCVMASILPQRLFLHLKSQRHQFHLKFGSIHNTDLNFESF